MRWVKLYTKFTEWEWHDVPEMVSLFFHLLVMAQHEDYSYHGRVIKRGQLQTSLEKLHALTGMSVQTIRTCLGKLQSTGEITSKSTNKFRVITICNYESYQENKSETNKQTNKQANKQPTNQQTRIKEIKNNKIERVENACAREEFFSDMFMQQMCMALHIDIDTYKTLAEETLTDWEITQHGDRDKRHFLSTMRIKVEAWRKRMSQPTKKTKEQIRAEALAMAQAAAYSRVKDYGINNN